MVIASLGGYMGRSCDGPPGFEVIWRGMKRLNDMALALAMAAESGRWEGE